MTIEERAQRMLEEIPNQKPWEGKEELKAKFAQYLRDQIEECAKIADHGEHPEYGHIAREIRRLAEPIEEQKETER